MRVVALFRVSSQKQENLGASLPAQERRYRELAATSGWETIAEFKGCESATKAGSEREVLQRVLACIREQPCTHLWVIEQSRLTRGDELEVAILIRELREREIKVLVDTRETDLADPSSSLMFGMHSQFDRYEAQLFKARVKRGKTEKSRQGKWVTGPAPYGYVNPPLGDQCRGVLQVHPEEAPVVRRIFQAAASAGEGLRSIAADLNREGIPSPRGCKWGKSGVRNILTNPVYTGRTPAVEGAHEPLVTVELWETVQATFRGHKSPRPQLLSGLLYIGGAKAVVDASRISSRGGRGTFYHPQDERGGWVRTETVNAAAWDGFLGLLRHPKALAALLRRSAQAGAGDGRERLAELAAHRERLAIRAARLVDLVADGTLSREIYRVKATETEAALREIGQQEVAIRRRQEAVQGGAVERTVQALTVLLGGKLSADQRRQVLRAAVARVDVELLRRPGKRTEILEASLGLRHPAQISTSCISELSRVTVPIIHNGQPVAPEEAIRRANAA